MDKSRSDDARKAIDPKLGPKPAGTAPKRIAMKRADKADRIGPGTPCTRYYARDIRPGAA